MKIYRIFFFIGVAIGLVMLSLNKPVHAESEQPLDGIAVEINNDVITLSELNHEVTTIKGRLSRQGKPLPNDAQLRHQVLSHMVLEHLQLQMAKKLMVSVDEAQVDEAAQAIAARNGISLDAFIKELKKTGMSYDEFKTHLKNEITISQLQRKVIVPQLVVKPKEIDAFMKNNADKVQHDAQYHVRDIVIALPETPSSEQLHAAKEKVAAVIKKLKDGASFAKTAAAESDADNALSGGDLGWRHLHELPKIFADVIRKLEPKQVHGPIRTSNGFHIIKLVEIKGDAQHIVNESKVSHILIHKSKLHDDHSSKKKLLTLRARLLKGDSFEKIAKKYSDDKVSASHGGDLGWVPEGKMGVEFDRAVAHIKPGHVSEPFKTPFGWHLVKLTERRKVNNTQSYQREQAEMMLRKQKFEEQLQAWQQELRDSAFIKIHDHAR